MPILPDPAITYLRQELHAFNAEYKDLTDEATKLDQRMLARDQAMRKLVQVTEGFAGLIKTARSLVHRRRLLATDVPLLSTTLTKIIEWESYWLSNDLAKYRALRQVYVTLADDVKLAGGADRFEAIEVRKASILEHQAQLNLRLASALETHNAALAAELKANKARLQTDIDANRIRLAAQKKAAELGVEQRKLQAEQAQAQKQQLIDMRQAQLQVMQEQQRARAEVVRRNQQLAVQAATTQLTGRQVQAQNRLLMQSAQAGSVTARQQVAYSESVHRRAVQMQQQAVSAQQYQNRLEGQRCESC